MPETDPGDAPMAGDPPAGDPTSGPSIDLSQPEPAEPATDADLGANDTAEGDDDPPTPRADTVTPDPTPTPPTVVADPGVPGGGPGAGRRPPWLLLLGVVAAIVVVVAVIFLTKDGDDEKPPDTSSSTTATTGPLNTEDWVTASDPSSGFSIKHPKEWERLEATGDVKVLLRFGPENVLGITARDIDVADAPNVIEQAMADVELIEEETPYSVDGFPGAVYIYTKPTSTESPGEGVIVHYFVVGRTKLYALVFVVSPAEELNRTAATISAVAQSFTSTVERPPTSTTTTTGPTASTPTTGG